MTLKSTVKLTVAGLAFTSFILPFLGGFLIWRLATANKYKADFLLNVF